ncbi:hypothetical protein NDU88_011406 [Pleurodeles waltl]|uniref:Uncharacterized protein n=1 Tax=Pleurodeles waltl TaxID=8319 RepID=A0AAV7Q4M4_PLEWA|nr:hypothetical protein NDU88_011406 [Pleurodeles waltl]
MPPTSGALASVGGRSVAPEPGSATGYKGNGLPECGTRALAVPQTAVVGVWHTCRGSATDCRNTGLSRRSVCCPRARQYHRLQGHWPPGVWHTCPGNATDCRNTGLPEWGYTCPGSATDCGGRSVAHVPPSALLRTQTLSWLLARRGTCGACRAPVSAWQWGVRCLACEWGPVRLLPALRGDLALLLPAVSGSDSSCVGLVRRRASVGFTAAWAVWELVTSCVLEGAETWDLRRLVRGRLVEHFTTRNKCVCGIVVQIGASVTQQTNVWCQPAPNSFRCHTPSPPHRVQVTTLDPCIPSS